MSSNTRKLLGSVAGASSAAVTTVVYDSLGFPVPPGFLAEYNAAEEALQSKNRIRKRTFLWKNFMKKIRPDESAPLPDRSFHPPAHSCSVLTTVNGCVSFFFLFLLDRKNARRKLGIPSACVEWHSFGVSQGRLLPHAPYAPLSYVLTISV